MPEKILRVVFVARCREVTIEVRQRRALRRYFMTLYDELMTLRTQARECRKVSQNVAKCRKVSYSVAK